MRKITTQADKIYNEFLKTNNLMPQDLTALIKDYLISKLSLTQNAELLNTDFYDDYLEFRVYDKEINFHEFIEVSYFTLNKIVADTKTNLDIEDLKLKIMKHVNILIQQSNNNFIYKFYNKRDRRGNLDYYLEIKDKETNKLIAHVYVYTVSGDNLIFHNELITDKNYERVLALISSTFILVSYYKI